MATILVRRLDSNWDPVQGAGLAAFAADLDAVQILLQTRLQLLEGEWWENEQLGTPLFQELLGHPITQQGVALILRKQILSTPYVTGITGLSVTYNGVARRFTFSANVITQFGTIPIASS